MGGESDGLVSRFHHSSQIAVGPDPRPRVGPFGYRQIPQWLRSRSWFSHEKQQKLGWNPASDSEVGGIYFRGGGHRRGRLAGAARPVGLEAFGVDHGCLWLSRRD